VKAELQPTEAQLANGVTRRTIRVLHVLGSLNPGGVETWLMNVLRHIDRDRFALDFCTFGPEPGVLAPEAERLGARVISCPKGKNIWSLGRRFRKILRAGHYDVVHSHVHYFSGVVLRWAAAEGVPACIAHAHTTNDGKPTGALRRAYRSQMRTWLLQNSTVCLAASRGAASLFGAAWESDPRCHVLYYGIDLLPFLVAVNRAEVRKELGIPSNAPVIGHAGRFVEAKNHRFLLQVAQEILNNRPNAHFLLVGDGPLREEIEPRARALARGDQIHFTGARSDVPRLLLAAMDVFLFPSLWEGLGLALAEAQAAGLPCLVSDAVPRDAVVIPELVHFCPLAKSAQVWARSVLTLLSQSPQDRNHCLSAFERSPFRVERSVERLSELYSESLASLGLSG
jgi:glycosyltransferase involved in cell wall biosynthesis